MLHARHIIKECDTIHPTQRFTVLYGNLTTCSNGGIHLPQIQQSVCGTHFIHFTVYTRSHHGYLISKAKILQIVYTFLGLFIVHDQSTTLYRIINLGGMETECGHIPRIQNAFTVYFHTKRMGRVINDF